MSATDQDTVDRRVVEAALRWIGTPYRHQGSRRGVGADCLGLVRGVWRETIGPEPVAVPPYARDADGLDASEVLLAALRTWLLPTDAIAPGTVIAFRWQPGRPARHCGIALTPTRMVHAYSGHGVVQSALVPAWRRRVAGMFHFPSEGALPWRP